MRPKILFLVTEDWYFWSHRLPLARAARDAGYQVVVATRIGRFGSQIEGEGFRLLPLGLRRGRKNPFREIRSVWELVRLYAAERPHIVHHVAIKPILYGSIAAKLTGVPAVVNAVTGLGSLFIAPGWRGSMVRRVVLGGYSLAFSGGRTTGIFQNREDADLFVRSGALDERKVTLIRGSGVDMGRFVPSPEPSGDPVVILASRLLWDKGVGEFVEAAKRLKAEGIRARFVLVGDSDPENPTAVPERRLQGWKDNAVVEWWGRHEDMPEVFAQCHVACLPSYREGLPKTLIEAAACGRPIVATDVPGCREIVRHEQNGLLVPPRNAVVLAASLRRLIEDRALRRSMGERGREIAVKEFSQESVIQQTLSVYRELSGGA